MPRDLVGLPKVHVHVHLDGSYPLTAVRALAGPAFEVPTSFPDVWSFFDAYGTVPPLVRTVDDLATLCRALVRAEAANGVLFLEPAIEPQLYAPRLGSLETVTRAIVDALQRAGDEAGIQVGANLTVNTDQDLPIADELARIAAKLDGITAFGTAGFVEPAGLGRFAGAAARARDAGLQIVAHAGQTGGPDSVREALDDLGATRLSHGIRSVEDPALLARLSDEQVVCDVAPVSNVRLGIVPTLAVHPAPALVAAGVPVTLNADDELWFGHSVVDQYRIAREEWGLSDAELAGIARAGLLIHGLNEDTRQRYLNALDDWLD
ncbi:adenosine deaminase family protein [Cryptosporangium phraense]|uniref:Adenosine deaminase family protein n=1 Tax=Cryptosporangium phraense TaxID=2593070 RepID=A0A545ADU9_9ACTN|nr:adenosine deaminase family protein [Cryptosporangium phraense]TQS39517.1 adenosine deaminase family protein [Cryptosporangium phraense]